MGVVSCTDIHSLATIDYLYIISSLIVLMVFPMIGACATSSPPGVLLQIKGLPFWSQAARTQLCLPAAVYRIQRGGAVVLEAEVVLMIVVPPPLNVTALLCQINCTNPYYNSILKFSCRDSFTIIKTIAVTCNFAVAIYVVTLVKLVAT